ncbi:hypothetical protein SAMN02949497_4128 [Methylomagnum ishizawai]|uniref:Mce/MlaD domain-containing protein n=1 Tax=Methylomagnum ishizawai TaxID=1760988 RepID=A0A1Y6D8H1_9GAMM|nr:MlaD family protein [Methylomagnum ishizawai]SMF96722.1 hypothetical protein SAMN02949497_4128 [Methylomagnum ishizawai]
MSIRSWLIVLFALSLSACGPGGLHLNLLLDNAAGISPQTPVVLGDRKVGQVTAINPDGAGGYVATLDIADEFRGSATQGSRFAVVRDPQAPDLRRIEFQPGPPGAAPLVDGAIVKGDAESGSWFPLGELLRGFTDGLGQLRGQLERFRSEMQRLPDSPEARHLQEEWARLKEEMQQAQQSTEESVKKDVLPRLQRELDELDRKFKALNAQPPAKSPPI